MTVPAARPWRLLLAMAFVLCAIGSSATPHVSPFTSATPSSYIVQAASTDLAVTAVTQVGGSVTRRLEIIDGVVATLGPQALAWLSRNPRIMLHADQPVRATAAPVSSEETGTEGYLLYPAAATGAHTLHQQQVWTPATECKETGSRQWSVVASSGQQQRPLQGWGVTVAVIDSGMMRFNNTNGWQFSGSDPETLVVAQSGRCIVYRDFLPRTSVNENSGPKARNSADQNGHGTHVIATIADNRATSLAPGTNPTPVGVAPQVNLLVARALDKDGAGTYADVIASIDWIVANKSRYNVRVLNLSLYAPAGGPYWADPLNQAVMNAWRAGIVVVAAAGNEGPTAGTITVPGNIPYVISVGAIKSGRYTESGEDELAAYSSRGPTESAFIKPDVLVPASRTIAPVPVDSTLYQQFPEASIQERAQVNYGIGQPARAHIYFRLSGTSMAAAEVSGIIALMLQKSPALTPDQVKYRLLATARPSIEQATGLPAYSVWEQGAGLVDVQRAVFSTESGSANQGMDINLDLTTDTHYWGYTAWDEASGEFQLIDPATGQPLEVWDGGSRMWSGGSRIWSGGSRIWSGGSTTWAGGSRMWSGGSRMWSGGSTTWAGSDSFWAGGSRMWSGSTSALSGATRSSAELLVND